MGMAPVLVLIVLVLLVAVYFSRHRESALRARFLKRCGFGVMALFGGFFGLFLIGETLSDPGGWKGAGIVALWVFPLAALCLFAWFRRDVAGSVFAFLIAAVIGMSVWFALDTSGWRSFEDHNGPVRAVIVFVLAAALALWGLRRTMWAGVMLVVLGVVPAAISSLGQDGFSSLAVASSAPMITGLLYVVSGVLDERQPPPVARSSPGDVPKAA